ncbi:MAG: hypothetical protein V1685_04045 [Parcubacteria group bacterium]
MRSPEMGMGEPEKQSPELTRERLADLQTLEVEIEADFGDTLQALRETTGADLQPRPEGYHLVIIDPTESKVLSTLEDATLTELQHINEQIQGGEGISIKGVGFIDGASSTYRMREVDKGKKTAFLALEIPALQAFRSKIGLPQKDFHITLGFEGGDIHVQVVRQEPRKPGSPKMKDVTAPIPKQADPRFSTLALPDIRYGGLDGQRREQTERPQ